MGDGQVNAIEQLRRWISIFTKEANSADSRQLKYGIDVLMNGTASLVNIMQSRFDAMSKQSSPKTRPKPRPSPPKLKPPEPIKPLKNTEKVSGGDRQKKNIASLSSIGPKTPSELAMKHQLLNKTYANPSNQLSLAKAAKLINR